jgi:hypothetical protein
MRRQRFPDANQPAHGSFQPEATERASKLVNVSMRVGILVQADYTKEPVNISLMLRTRNYKEDLATSLRTGQHVRQKI